MEGIGPAFSLLSSWPQPQRRSDRLADRKMGNRKMKGRQIEHFSVPRLSVSRPHLDPSDVWRRRVTLPSLVGTPVLPESEGGLVARGGRS